MLVRAKTSAVITYPDGSLMPVGKGKILDCPNVVYNSCWEILERLDDNGREVPKEPGQDIARVIESQRLIPRELAVLNKPTVKLAKK